MVKNDEVNDALKYMTKWIVSQGGEASPHLHGNMTRHAGGRIRGVIASKTISSGATLFAVPKKLWLVLSNFPSFANAILPDTSKCKGLGTWEQKRLKLAAAVAMESKKGMRSAYGPYIQGLPSLSDYESFLPNFVSAELAANFSALPLVSTSKEIQQRDREYSRGCFDQWQKQSSSPLSDLSWNDMLLALTQFRTRCYGTSVGVAMIPGSDMLNTAKAQDMNTAWSDDGEAFHLVGGSDAVNAGQELYDTYCDACDNSNMLKVWGAYLEDNRNQVVQDHVDCAALKGGNMHKAMDATLDFSSTSASWRSPRCHASVFSAKQGPLQCSLARLTWEYCGEAWRSAPGLSLLQSVQGQRGTSRALSPQEDALLVLQTARGAVPKAFQGKTP